MVKRPKLASGKGSKNNSPNLIINMRKLRETSDTTDLKTNETTTTPALGDSRSYFSEMIRFEETMD